MGKEGQKTLVENLDQVVSTEGTVLHSFVLVLPAWQVCCVVCCTEVEGWGVETVTGGRAGRECFFLEDEELCC